jgi:hypothetical protein
VLLLSYAHTSIDAAQISTNRHPTGGLQIGHSGMSDTVNEAENVVWGDGGGVEDESEEHEVLYVLSAKLD